MAACDPITITSADGAMFSLRAHGAHVTGWTPAGGSERLWLSRTSGCGPGTAIRGGIPVVWPQFSDRGPLPKHGFARDRAWDVVHVGQASDGAADAELVLRDDAATRAIWPHEFTLTLTVRATGNELALSLRVDNTGAQHIEFTAALHAYLTVTDLPQARLHGVGGATAEDNANHRAPVILPAGPLPVSGPLDLAVRDVSGAVTLDDPGHGSLRVSTRGLSDIVVWNPGTEAAPPDVHPGGEAEFVCVEPAALTSAAVAPGASWQASATFRSLAASR